MTQDIKTKIQDSYLTALANRAVQKYRMHDLFRDVKLYGHDAGVDFVNTNLERIVQEAVEVASCKEPSLELTVHGFGRAALQGVADALREATSLKVVANKSSAKLIWAEVQPGLV